MELLHIENVNCQRQMDAQYYYFLINYLIGEKFLIHSNVGFMLHVYKYIENKRNSEVVDYYEYCAIHATDVMDDEKRSIYKEIDAIKKDMKIIFKLKKITHLTKVGFETIRIHNETINECKNGIYKSIEEYIKNAELDKLLDLYDEDFVKCTFSLLNRDSSLRDEEISEKIYNNLKTREKLFVLDDVSQFALELTEDDLEQPEPDEENTENFISTQLILTIPCSKVMPLNNLLIIKNKLQFLIDNAFNKIQEFRITISNLKLNNSIKELLEKFSDNINEEMQILQNEIDNNIYIKGIKNSDKDYQEVNIKFGILPYESVLNIFAIKNIISQNKLSEIKYRLKNYLLDNSCEIFLFYEIKPKINEEENKVE